MKQFIGTIVFTLAMISAAHAQDGAANTAPAKSESSTTVGDAARQAGHEIKVAAHKVRKAVITICGDGRHTIKGASGCRGHGGVSARN